MWSDLLPAGAHLLPVTAGGALTSRLCWMTKVQSAKMDKRNDCFCCKCVNQAQNGGLLNAVQEYSTVTNLSWYMAACRRDSTETGWSGLLVCPENKRMAASEYLWLSSMQVVKAKEQNLSNRPPYIQLEAADSQSCSCRRNIWWEKKRREQWPISGVTNF